MTIRQWIRISPGIALYREGLTWLIDARIEKRRVVMSTKTRSLPEAIRKIETIYYDRSYSRQFKNRRVIKVLQAQLQDANSKLAEVESKQPVLGEADIERVVTKFLELQGHPPRTHSVREAVSIQMALDGHLANIRAGESTSTKYQKQIPGWINRLAEQAGVKTVGEVTRTHLNNHVTWLRTPSAEGGGGLSPKTVYNVKGGLKEFFAYCLSEKWIEESPAHALKLGKIPKPRIRFYTTSEIDTVLAVGSKSYGADAVATFAVSCFSGPRLEEIYTVERDRIHFERRKFELWDNKRGEWKDTPIFDCLVPYLERLVSESKGRLPFARRSLGALGASVSRLVKRALPNKDLIQHDAGGERVDAMLTCRRTFSTHLRALGVSDRVVAKWSGHEPAVDSSTYCGTLPDGERAYPIKFLGEDLISEGLPCPYPEPSRLKKIK